jgi:DNA-binding LytR/AlgR family response regulator
MNEPVAKETLVVKTNGRWALLKFGDIDAIVAHAHASRIFAGGEQYMVRQGLAALHNALPQDRFLRVSRATIVNLDRVRAVHSKSHGDGIVELTNGERYSISRRFRKFLGVLYPNARRRRERVESGGEPGIRK